MDKRKQLKEIEFIIDNFDVEKINFLYPKLLKTIKISEDKKFEEWFKLEIFGYLDSNDSFSEGTNVPKYRKVPGYFYNRNYQKIIFPNDLLELSSFYLRESLFELIGFSKSDNDISIEHEKTNSILKDHFNIDVTYFVLNPIYLQTVINEISTRILDWLIDKRSSLILELTNNNLNLEIPYELSQLHMDVQNVCGKLFENGHYRQCVLDIFIKIVEKVKEKSGLTNVDNTPLMQKAFSPNSPIIKVSEDNDEQQGIMWLFSGATMAFRNSNAHKLDTNHEYQQTLELLHFASYLLTTIENA